MDLGLTGRVALVAGGTSGIGLACAREFAAEGAHVAVCGRDPDRLAAAERELSAVATGLVHASRVDLADGDAGARWVERVAADLGGVHVLLVSGGSPPIGTATMFGPDDYRAAVDRVLLPAVTVSLAAVARMRAAGWGRVLLVASETACVPIGPLALSGVTRAALVRFAQGLAVDVGRDGVTVNVLAPGGVRTPPMERAAARLAGADGDVGERLAAMGHHSALGRLARPDEVAAVAAFLAGERASYVTAGVHLIDGGAAATGPDLPHLTGVRRDTYA
ncbi:SDR family NAD(P)-dependent oxidoreductase [Micromonospora auratinigra]|uniref:3-oxoacyl-[acyl-carrier protein] reductase n=1 Tax=Micromonospora auratinigra TaxID=261654 RepID=A0A1A8Z958_9ACTN|nr:SDR family oxidoreductase [Micromonospora auratinigra]SBT40398.1 3-oxoacyl-[acyl-carrier protein] reductase [Micromonospora auratinigra]